MPAQLVRNIVIRGTKRKNKPERGDRRHGTAAKKQFNPAHRKHKMGRKHKTSSYKRDSNRAT